MKKYFVSVSQPPENYGEPLQIYTRYVDFKEITSEKNVAELEAKCQYILDSKKWKLIGYSLVGEADPPQKPPMEFKKSPISKKDTVFLKKLQHSISEVRQFDRGGQYYNWIGKFLDPDIARIKKILAGCTDVYIVPRSVGAVNVGYNIKLIPAHYPFLKKELETLLFFSEDVFEGGRQESKLFFPICKTQKNLKLVKLADPGTSVQDYHHYEY